MKLPVSIFIVFSFLTSITFGQKVKTKDGVLLGDRKDFISSCASGAEEEMMNLKGMEINTYDYCSCVCDNIIPMLQYDELDAAIKNDNLVALFMKEENLNEIKNCLKGNLEVDEEFEFNKNNRSEVTIELAKQECINGILEDPEMNEAWSEEMADDYCACAMDKLYSKGYTFKDLLDIENEDSESFNEIAVPCVTEILSKYKENLSDNNYVPSDITGSPTSSKIILLDYLGNGYKLKISINGISKYFLFDTGASDLIINQDFERELLIEGAIKKDDYQGEKTYSMANNEEVEAQMVKLNDIQIGDYTVNNVIVAVLKEGSLLCGKGFLDKFKKWELDQENKTLTLYR